MVYLCMHATSAGAGPAGSAVFLPTTCTVALPPVLAVPNERASVSMSHTVRVVCGEQTTERRNKKGKDRSFTDPRMALREPTVESGDRHVSRRYLWLLLCIGVATGQLAFVARSLYSLGGH